MRPIRAYLNGIDLGRAIPGAMLLEVTESAPKVNAQASAIAGRAGQWFLSADRQQLDVQLSIGIRERYDPVRRAKIRDQIAEWCANGGWLTLSYRPNQRLWVHPTDVPALGKSFIWTEKETLTLTAYEHPYWEDATETAVTLDKGTSNSGVITLPGNAGRVECDAEITVATGTLTDITLTVGSTYITLTGLTVTDSVTIGHTDEGILTINSGSGAALLRYRTDDSSDELLATCGGSTDISYEASKAVTVKVVARGRWL